MKVRDLIEQLESMDPEAEVRMAQQPSWPFEYSIREVVEVAPECDACDGGVSEDEDGDDETCRKCGGSGNAEGAKVVYLEEGAQLGYLPGVASRALGWR